MTVATPALPGLEVERRGSETELRLTGDWIAQETGLRDDAAVARMVTEAGDAARLRFDTSGLGRWDSALVTFVLALRTAGPVTRTELDETGLPAAARRLLALASDAAPGSASGSERKHPSASDALADRIAAGVKRSTPAPRRPG